MITHKIKNIALGITAILLLISGGLNFIQINSAKREQIARNLDHERSNTIIATQKGQILLRDSLIAAIRKERRETTVKDSVAMAGLKTRVAVLRGEIAKLPRVIKYNPDSATVDSLRIAFVLKDSVIDTQALMITSLEVEKEGIVYSFYKEIALLNEQNNSQAEISNQLQNQLISAQSETRKEKRKKKFFRFLAGVGIATAGVLAITSQ